MSGSGTPGLDNARIVVSTRRCTVNRDCVKVLGSQSVYQQTRKLESSQILRIERWRARKIVSQIASKSVR